MSKKYSIIKGGYSYRGFSLFFLCLREYVKLVPAGKHNIEEVFRFKKGH